MTNIPDLPLEAEAISEVEEIRDESGGCINYAFIGSGQGGGRIAESFYKRNYRKVIVCNTAPQDLASLAIPDDQKLLFDAGQKGAGKDMRSGEQAAEKGQHRLYELMLRKFGKPDHILICVTAGGGSGAGSTLILIETAKKFLNYVGVENVDKKVGVILTLPTNGECASPNVATNAQFIVKKLCEDADKRMISPLIIVDNDKIQKLFPKLTVKQFYSTVNDTITGLFHIFNVIPVGDTQYITFDTADYASLMQSGGCMIMGVTAVKDLHGDTAIANAIKTNLERTLLADDFDLRTATHAAALVLGGSGLFSEIPGLMKSIEDGFDALAVLTGDAMIHRGIYEDAKERLNVYTLVGGLSTPVKRINALGRFQGVSADSKMNSKMPKGSFKNKLYNE